MHVLNLDVTGVAYRVFIRGVVFREWGNIAFIQECPELRGIARFFKMSIACLHFVLI